MGVKKSLINSINKLYLQYIKDCYQNEEFSTTNMEVLLCTVDILDRKVDFYLEFKFNPNSIYAYSSGALYYHKKVNGKYRIVINCTISKSFNETFYTDLNLNIKSLLHHEIEHHLQKAKMPFREKLPELEYPTIMDYVNSSSEIEAYTKQLYLVHKKTKINFTKLLVEEANKIIKKEEVQDAFISNVISFIVKRNDLNLFNNIKF